MSKTLKITIIVLITVLIISMVGFLFFYKNSVGNNGIDIIKNTLPFGENTSTTTNTIETQPVNNSSDTVGWIGEKTKPRLFEIHKGAIAGSYAFERNTDSNSSIFIRYISRGIGNIFETNMESLKESRVSNTTRLKIYQAIWGNAGKNVIIRYLDDQGGDTVRSFVITIPKTSTSTSTLDEFQIQQTQKTKGLFLPENIKEIARSEKDDQKIFYLFNNKDSSVGIIYNLENEKSTQIFQSPFTEWLPQWPTKNIITLTTKPSSDVPGFMYFLNIKTEGLVKILGDIKGLTTLTSPDGEKILYSESNKGWVSLKLYNIKNHSTKILPFSTLPEKCVWSNTNKYVLYCAVPKNPQIGDYPDQWYQGLTSFSDDIWMINIKTSATERILSPIDTARVKFDVIKPQINKDDHYIFFTNKKDMSLWGINLKKDTSTNLD